MLLPISTSYAPPPQSSGSGDPSSIDQAISRLDAGASVLPIKEAGASDTGNKTSSNTFGSEQDGYTGQARRDDPDASADNSAAPPPAVRVSNSSAAGPTPYVAPPAVEAEFVAEAQARAETQAERDAAVELKTSEAQDKQFAEAAKDRAANEAMMAAIVPPPENAPSLKNGVEELRAEEARQAAAAPTLEDVE